MRESVIDLRKSLRERGGDLIVRLGNVERVVEKVVRGGRCGRVVLGRDIGLNGMEFEERLRKKLGKAVDVEVEWSCYLFGEKDLPVRIGEVPNEYIKFREMVQGKGNIGKPVEAPKQFMGLPRGIEAGEIPSLGQLGCDESLGRRSEVQYYYGEGEYVGGEREALKRVKEYVEDCTRIDADFSPHAIVGSSLGREFGNRIAPWLALGCVSPRRIFEELRKRAPPKKAIRTSSTFRELSWRDFFRYTTFRRNSKIYAESHQGKSKIGGKSGTRLVNSGGRVASYV